MSDVTVTNEPPLANDPAARTADGTLIDQSKPNTTPTPPPTPDPAKVDPPKPADPPKSDDKAPPAPAAGAPEKYTDFKLPDGVKLDPKAIEGAQAVFKELNIPQEGAQKLVDFYTANLKEANEAPYKLWADTQKAWTDEITSRFGDKAETIRADINKAIDVALSPSVAKAYRTAMDLTGAGSNPDIMEALNTLLAPHFEGKPVVGGKPSPEGAKAPGSGPISIADAMYPHLRK